MDRIFVYDGREFPDPDPVKTVEEVRAYFATFFPELSNAETKDLGERKREGSEEKDHLWEFKKRVGTKGETAVEEPCRLGHCVKTGNRYSGPLSKTDREKVDAGICPVCGGKLVNSPSGR